MSEIILDFLNKEVKLTKKVKNIEKEFRNGYLFAELLQKTGFLIPNDISLFNRAATSTEEIKKNYSLLKDSLQYLGVYLDDLTINDLSYKNKSAISNLLYKIKTQMDRRKVKFDEIMNKINKFEKEENKEKSGSKKNFARTTYDSRPTFNKNKSKKKLPELTYMSTFYGTTSNFNSIKNKGPTSPGLTLNTLGNNVQLPEKNKFATDKILDKKKCQKKNWSPSRLKSRVYKVNRRLMRVKFQK